MKKLFKITIAFLLCLSIMGCSKEPVTFDLVAISNTNETLYVSDWGDELKGTLEFKDDSFTEGTITCQISSQTIDATLSDGILLETANEDGVLNYYYQYSMEIDNQTATCYSVQSFSNDQHYVVIAVETSDYSLSWVFNLEKQ